jgi:hypothetical protein
MSRPRRSKNKQVSVPVAYSLRPTERIDLITGLLIDIVCEELWTDD